MNWTLRPWFYTRVQNFCVSYRIIKSNFDTGTKQKLCPKKVYAMIWPVLEITSLNQPMDLIDPVLIIEIQGQIIRMGAIHKL